MQFDWCMVWNWLLGLLSRESAPAWVQAVGSIVALIVAILLPKFSAKQTALLKQKTIFSIAEATHEYARNVRAAIEYIDDEPGSNSRLYAVYHRDVVAELVKALQSVPVHELGSADQVLAILGLINQLVFLGSSAEKLLVDPSLLPEFSKTWSSADYDRELRREIRSTAITVLKKNALRHLDEIDKHYNNFKKTLIY